MIHPVWFLIAAFSIPAIGIAGIAALDRFGSK